MKFYKQLQICFPLDTENPKLDFMSYHDNSAGCKKISETQREWAFDKPGHNPILKLAFDKYVKPHQYYWSDEYNREAYEAGWAQYRKIHKWILSRNKFTILDNTPARGFKIGETVERWSTSNKLFRLTDPRGFIVELSANNLVHLMMTSKIEHGEIMDECVWFRNGGNNWLMNVNSDEYQEEMRKINAVANSVKPSKLNVGDVVDLTYYGDIYEDMVYLGKRQTLTNCSVINRDGSRELTVNKSDKKYHCFLSKDKQHPRGWVNRHGNTWFVALAIATPKVLKVKEPNYTTEDTLKESCENMDWSMEVRSCSGYISGIHFE